MRHRLPLIAFALALASTFPAVGEEKSFEASVFVEPGGSYSDHNGLDIDTGLGAGFGWRFAPHWTAEARFTQNDAESRRRRVLSARPALRLRRHGRALATVRGGWRAPRPGRGPARGRLRRRTLPGSRAELRRNRALRRRRRRLAAATAGSPCASRAACSSTTPSSTTTSRRTSTSSSVPSSGSEPSRRRRFRLRGVAESASWAPGFSPRRLRC